MKASTVHYFSDDTFAHLASEYFIDGEQVSLPEYVNFIQEKIEIDEEGDELEDSVVNVNIESLTISNVFDMEYFVEQLKNLSKMRNCCR